MKNSANQDKMPHKLAFHQCLHCLLGQNRSSEKDISRALGCKEHTLT